METHTDTLTRAHTKTRTHIQTHMHTQTYSYSIVMLTICPFMQGIITYLLHDAESFLRS